MSDPAAEAVPGMLAAVAAGAAIAALASLVALGLSRHHRRGYRARGRNDMNRRRMPAPVSASWLIAAVAAFGALLWVPGPADRFGSVV